MSDQTITLDGVQYPLDQFSQQVVQAVGIYNGFSADLHKEQLAVIKTQAALQHLGNQIAEAVKKELAAKEAANDTPAEVQATATE